MTTDAITRLNAALEGRYRVERQLGVGGMSTVYLARDVRHDRHVALKVLKPELAAVVGAQRFLMEIRTTAGLQHPHILPLFDSGEADDQLFYVMPFVEGETLRERLDRERQLPVDEAVRIACEVAGALQHAHEQGVIHRDVKPANILLASGMALVSDFGIALALSAGGGHRLTETGLSLGTPHYMSPEQATGDASVGPPTDVWALGCVLYEMLVGEPPFTGATPQAVLGRIITGLAPRAGDQRSSVPPNVDHALRVSLAKIPADRFPTTADMAEALVSPAFRASGGRGPGEEGSERRWRTVGGGALAASVVLAATLGWALTGGDPPPQVSRYAMAFGPEEELRPSVENSLALSPDGRRLVYVGPGEGAGTALWLKERDRLRARRLPGTEGVVTPFFSPDGERIGFVHPDEGRALYVLSLDSGERIALADGLALTGGSWGPDGHIYATDRDEGVMVRISATSGETETVTALEATEQFHMRPQVSWSGETLFFTVIPTDAAAAGHVAATRVGTSSHRAVADALHVRHASTGHIIVVRDDGTLAAGEWDESDGALAGPLAPLAGRLAVAWPINEQGVDLALSRTGTLVYIGQGETGGRTVAWFHRDGTVEPIDHRWPTEVESVSLSPEGERFFATLAPDFIGSEIWMTDLRRPQAPTLLASGGGLVRRPVWTAGGDSVAYIALRDGNRDAYIEPALGIGEPQVLLDLEEDVDEIVVHPDGWLIYRTGTSPGSRRLWAARRDGGAAPVAISPGPDVDAFSPVLSPDGRWIAYQAGADDAPVSSGIWVHPFPDVDRARWLVAENGAGPAWAPSGGEIFYRTPTHLVSVAVSTDPDFAPGVRREVIELEEGRVTDLRTDYSVSPDGERFLMIRGGARHEVVVVENFNEELRGLTQSN